MTTVGTVYDKLEKFLNAVADQQAASEEDSAEVPTEEAPQGE
jgi:hypothetical protein